MAKLPNRLVIEISNTDKVDESGNPVIGFESKDYAECVIEELEKIKEEIKGLIDFEESCCGNTTLGYECLGVINNKLSELKGEKNDIPR